MEDIPYSYSIIGVRLVLDQKESSNPASQEKQFLESYGELSFTYYHNKNKQSNKDGMCGVTHTYKGELNERIVTELGSPSVPPPQLSLIFLQETLARKEAMTGHGVLDIKTAKGRSQGPGMGKQM